MPAGFDEREKSTGKRGGSRPAELVLTGTRSDVVDALGHFGTVPVVVESVVLTFFPDWQK